MGMFKLGVTLCQMCSTFVMSFTPQHDKMSLLEVLPNSLGTEVPAAFWLSCCHTPCEMGCVTAQWALQMGQNTSACHGRGTCAWASLSSAVVRGMQQVHVLPKVGWMSSMTQRGQLARNKLVSVVLASNRAKFKWGKFEQFSNSASKAGVRWVCRYEQEAWREGLLPVLTVKSVKLLIAISMMSQSRMLH